MNLIEFTQKDFEAYWNFALNTYANELSRSNNSTFLKSLKIAKKQLGGLLPYGILTKHQFLYRCSSEFGDVGMIWVGLYLERGEMHAFIYDFHIWKEYRGKGFSKIVMSLIEKKAKYLGAKFLGLHVFRHNNIAFNLYEKLGYVIYLDGKKSVEMKKSL